MGGLQLPITTRSALLKEEEEEEEEEEGRRRKVYKSTILTMRARECLFLLCTILFFIFHRFMPLLWQHLPWPQKLHTYIRKLRIKY